MGQRSQIYVRYPKSEGKKGLIAKYFGWNYGERMVSRARHGMEYIHETHSKDSHNRFVDMDFVEKIKRIFETNFNLIDVAITCDIIKEWNEQFASEEFKEAVFYRQDNNNGKLFVDVLDSEIKYCFTDSKVEVPMSAEEYMKWDEDTDDWQEYFRQSEYYDEEDIATCLANIERIGEIATVMTEEELQAFLEYDYLADFDENELPVQKMLNMDMPVASFAVANMCLKDILDNKNYILKADWRDEVATEMVVYKLLMGLPICITSTISGDKHIVENAKELTELQYWMKYGIAVTIKGRKYVFSELSEEEREYLLNRKVIVNTIIGLSQDATKEQVATLEKVVKNYY